MRRLIVNADDFGLCPGSIEGILHGIRRGIITSTSVMTTMPACASALAAIRAHPDLDVGVHLTLTEGRPAAGADRVPGLVDSTGALHATAWWHERDCRPDFGEIETEFRAQAAAILDTGAKLTHVDLHTHVGYLIPEVFEMTVRLARQLHAAIRFPFDPDWDKGMLTGAALAGGLPEAGVRQAVERYRRLVEDAGVPHPDRLIDAFPDVGTCTADALARLVRALPDGTTELLTHAGFEKGCRKLQGDASGKRAAELAALCDPAVRQVLAAEGIELVGFSRLVS